MRKISMAVGLALLALLAANGQPALRAQEGPYKFIKDIPIGGEGGWDYASVDSAARRLYVTHATKVVVIDIDKDTVVGEVAPTPGVHGFAIAPALGLGFVSIGQQAKAGIVDLKTLQIQSTVDTGQNPDAILYEPGRQEVYAFNGRSNSATVFEAKTGKVVATIPLSGKPEFAQADPKAGRVYNNIEDKNEIAVIDTKTHTVVASWPIAPGEEASGLALDVAHHRLFLCASNNLMVMMDSTNGKVLGSVKIGPGADATAYDPVTNYVFASSSDGTLTVAQATSTTDFKVVQTVKTPARSRTMTIDPKTHNLYLAAAEFQPPPPPKEGEKPGRPTMAPNSFKVVVYGLSAPPKK